MAELEIRIREDDPRRPEIVALLEVHLAFMATQSPPESRHALDVEGLCRPDITFWSVWNESDLIGCGALRELDPRHGEIKSMHTAQVLRGQGLGGRILTHIIEEGRRRGYARLSLETGSMAGFAPAHALYGRFGFAFCPPFGSYREDPNSVFMTLALSAAPS